MKIRAILGIGLALALPGVASADLNISKKATLNMDCAGGVCTATDKKANLNVGDLTARLASGDLTVRTGGGALAIQVNDGFSWTSTSRLTLDANTSVSVHKPVAVAGTGGLTVITNDGGTDGDLNFFDTGKVDFWDVSSSLKINNTSYTLVSDIVTLSDAIKLDPTGSYAFSQDHDATFDGTYRHAPIRTDPFEGKLEGLGHTVSNLRISTSDSATGLFASSAGVIRDVHLTNATIKAHGGFIGALVGANSGTLIANTVAGSVQGLSLATVGGLVGSSSGAILRCNSSGTVSGPLAGGLAGSTSGSIADSSSSARVTAPSTGGSGPFGAGGLAGDVSGTISNSHAIGAVGEASSAYPAGGLVAILEPSGTIDGSSASGNVVSLYYWAGGLVSSSAGNIRNSFATGAVVAKSTDGPKTPAGGLVGYNIGSIADSYARGAATTDEGDVGGLVGQSFGQIARAYSTGTVTANQVSGSNVGGFIGSDFHSGGIKKSYWDMDTSGVTNPAQGAGNVANDSGIAGLSDAQLKAHLPRGFDPATWAQDAAVNDGYPYLLANAPQ